MRAPIQFSSKLWKLFAGILIAIALLQASGSEAIKAANLEYHGMRMPFPHPDSWKVSRVIEHENTDGLSVPRHAIDFDTNTDDPIHAAHGGELVCKGSNCYGAATGIALGIDHKDGYCSVYYHLNSISEDLSLGDWIQQGQYLGGSGATGGDYGDHLHFAVIKKT